MKKLWSLVKKSKTKLLAGVMVAQAGSTNTSSWLPNFANNQTLPEIVRTALTVVFGLAGVIAVIYLIYGGYQYITAGGGEGADAGKKTILNAIIGVIIVIAAYAIINYIWSIFTGGDLGNQTI